jgi:ATP synthase protein I
MPIIVTASEIEADAPDEWVVEPLTAEQAQAVRKKLLPFTPWRVVGWQLAAGGLVVLAAWSLTQNNAAAWSASYGAASALIPAAIFARGFSRQRDAANAGAALAGFFVWEMVKVALTVAMLFAAPRLVVQLNWLALLAGFVVTMKASWLAVWFRLVRNKSVNQ